MKRVILKKQMIIVGSIVMLSFFCYSCPCILGPVPPLTNADSRGPIDDETLSFLQVGMSKKEDVLLRLGNPTTCSKNDDSLEYCWPRLYGGIIYGFSTAAAVTGIGKTYCVSVEFDEHGILKKYEVKRNVELQTEYTGKPIQCFSKDKQPDVAK